MSDMENLIEKENDCKLSTATWQDILSVTYTTKDMSMKRIKQAVVAKLNLQDIFLTQEVEQEVERLIKEDKRRGADSELLYKKPDKYRKRRMVSQLSAATCNPNYLGVASEVAVMAELLFNGYNVNRMILDEGLDLVATKDGKVYFVQVKSTLVNSNGTFDWQIPLQAYNANRGDDVRYIFVGRYKDRKKDNNLFFILKPALIDFLISGQCVKQSQSNICVKIKFNTLTGEAQFYDNREYPAEMCKDNFDLGR